MDAAIEKNGTKERRVRLLPSRSLVYWELAQCLFPGEGYEQVLDHLLPGENDLDGPDEERAPRGSSLCRARVRTGARTMESVFREVAGPVASSDSFPSAFWRGLRLLAFDGTVFDVADTDANAAEFSRPAGSCGVGGYPQARVVALVECGTRAVLDAAIGGRGQGETTLARQLASATGAGTLVLADRNMLGVDLWNSFLDTGSQLLWRLKNSVATRPDTRLADGSWLTRVRMDKHTAAALRRAGKPVPSAVTVRVIEYTLPGSTELYRLGTSLLDPATAPAHELAALYHHRWESEGVFAEIKTVQRGPHAVLRSARPDGIRQQIWAHLTVHHLTHNLICHAAIAGAQPEPLRLSFRRAQHFIRRHIGAAATPQLLERLLKRTREAGRGTWAWTSHLARRRP